VPRDAGNDDCAGVMLAGETSLSSAVIHGDWVSSHDHYGRNRP
jgi:hydroxymethylglutaryl-CoA reductase (NADPH)